MQPTTSKAKKRRLDALTQLHQSASAAATGVAQQRQQQQQQQRQQPPRGKQGWQTTALQGVAGVQGSAAPGQQAASSDDHQEGPAQFPYKPLSGSHISARLQLTSPSACKGNLENALEGLMTPHMPLPVAQSMIASRTAADKAVVLVNPTGRINLARPSASSRGQRQLLAGKLLPRPRRMQLSTLPKSGINYAAMLSLHDLWCTYAHATLSNSTADHFGRLLQTIDWHGALVRVVSSKNAIYLHRAGIVAKVTQATFVLVSDDGRSSIIPLKGTMFECSVDCGRLVHVVLSGDNLKSLKAVEKT